MHPTCTELLWSTLTVSVILFCSTFPLLDDSDVDAYSTFPLLGDSGPWQLLNVSITRRFHTLVIFLNFYSTFPLLDVSRLPFHRACLGLNPSVYEVAGISMGVHTRRRTATRVWKPFSYHSCYNSDYPNPSEPTTMYSYAIQRKRGIGSAVSQWWPMM